jgi:CO/xanthine dehydrogenase Mo-binding subunit
MIDTADKSSMLDRREFLRRCVVGGVGVVLLPFPSLGAGSFGWQSSRPDARSGPPQGRIDGYPKVTGSKLFSTDFRAADMPGWPNRTSHAMLLRARDVTHVFAGIDLSSLEPSLQPDRTVLAEDLAKAQLRVPAFYAGDLLCPAGQAPAYLGQPLALLIWSDFAAFAEARQILRSATNLMRRGADAAPQPRIPYGGMRYVRIAGPTPDAEDVYSPLLEGWTVPARYQPPPQLLQYGPDPPRFAAEWDPPNAAGSPAARASYYGQQVRRLLDEPDPDLLVIDQTFSTPSNDPVFLEPENGLAWHDLSRRTLELVLGTQSPEDSASSIAELVGEAPGDLRVESVVAHCTSIGGGFGGRDHSIFPLYVALAGLFAANTPVRLANDRFEQFQSGLKRHAFQIASKLGVDRKSGKLVAYAADLTGDGGGWANYSASVGLVAAAASIGIYDIPKVDVTSVVLTSVAVPAGSMRGYGTLQSMTPLEVMIDRAAEALGRDPIALRKANALASGQKNLTGNIPSGAVRTQEVLDKLAGHRIWTERSAEKKRRDTLYPGKAYGVGVACVNKDYGGGADAALAKVEITPEGRILVTSSAVEIGTGLSTAIAVRAADHLGACAERVTMGALSEWKPLRLVSSGDPYTIAQADQDAAAKNPRWVPRLNVSTYASIGAHIDTHVVAEAARVVYRFGLWPAAVALWGQGVLGGQAIGEFLRSEDGRFPAGTLTAAGMEPLPLARLAAKAHEMGLVTTAMVHGFNRWSWAVAAFEILGVRWEAPIDALAVQYGRGAGLERRASLDPGGFHVLDRISVRFPDTRFQRFGTNYVAACGSLAAVEIERSTGTVGIVDAYSVFECGRALVPEAVSAQAQGGFAQGVGFALTEYLPLLEGGPGSGDWNLDRYRVPRASDLPLWNLEIEILPSLGPTDVPKGIAEVVMIPIAPALLNAIYDATGRRFTSVPVTTAAIKEALG